ncbi:MAG TPA: FAD-binding oxidoreductase [Candidatus Paceibacterota bacterium]|nr:FAD-binding oxidoreductase [Candidatus Paceibacterota bacterium]
MKFRVEKPFSFFPGQYCNIRINSSHNTKPRRSYSIVCTEAQNTVIEFGIKIIPHGEVSQLLQTAQIGDEVEIQGPLGNHFVWNPETHDQNAPLLLIASGSGIAPLISVIRARHSMPMHARPETILIYSVKHSHDIAYEQELHTLREKDTRFTYIQIVTQEPAGKASYSKRIDKELLNEECGRFLDRIPSIYVSGSSDFVNTISNQLQALGIAPKTIYSESFI